MHTQTTKETKLWDLYYNGVKVQDVQGVPYGVLAKRRAALVRSKTHTDTKFSVRFHGL